MELVLPSQKAGYSGTFLVGHRKMTPGQTERTGTVVLKRSYTIDSASGALRFVETPLPIFMTDLPHNLVQNGDFESELEADPQPWQAENSIIDRINDPDDADNHLLQMQGSAGGQVFQQIVFGQPLGGDDMTLALQARSSGVPARIEVCLEAEREAPPGVVKICAQVLDLTIEPVACSLREAWPADLGVADFRVVLRLLSDTADPIFIDDVLVFTTLYDEHDLASYKPELQVFTTLYYEHDLASYKRLVDIVVPGFVPPLADKPLTVDLRVRQNGAEQIWLQRTLGLGDRHQLFGWAPRAGGPREAQAGTYPVDPGVGPLPDDFDNHFFNGYRRDPDSSPGASLAPDAEIMITRAGNVDYRFQLPGDTAEATLAYYKGNGPDQPDQWQATLLPMRLDTLVVEPEHNRCYLVWRGVWPFDDYAEDSYRRLTVQV